MGNGVSRRLFTVRFWDRNVFGAILVCEICNKDDMPERRYVVPILRREVLLADSCRELERARESWCQRGLIFWYYPLELALGSIHGNHR